MKNHLKTIFSLWCPFKEIQVLKPGKITDWPTSFATHWGDCAKLNVQCNFPLSNRFSLKWPTLFPMVQTKNTLIRNHYPFLVPMASKHASRFKKWRDSENKKHFLKNSFLIKSSSWRLKLWKLKRRPTSKAALKPATIREFPNKHQNEQLVSPPLEFSEIYFEQPEEFLQRNVGRLWAPNEVVVFPPPHVDKPKTVHQDWIIPDFFRQ